ncbi:MAG TPA: carboxypeptidase-like regulatory domain-containing protein, partial [Pirellulaceae bacterium]
MACASDGSFTVRGVDGSFKVRHSDYLSEEVYIDEAEAGRPQVVRLARGESIRGVVRDGDGKVLAGVAVDDGSGKRTITGPDGMFELRGLRKWNGDRWRLEFKKEGYDDVGFQSEKAGEDGVAMVMRALPELRGQVVLPGGEPARRYLVMLGPGPRPGSYACVKERVDDADGRFLVRPRSLPEVGNGFWIGVKAEGAAPWEGLVSLEELSGGDFRIALDSGFTLSGILWGPESGGDDFEVTLEERVKPAEKDENIFGSGDPEPLLPGVELDVANGAPLRIQYLRTGEYRLRIRGEGATPLELPVSLRDGDLDMGELRLAGTGPITGIVHELDERKEPWRFADGGIFLDGFGDDAFEPYLRFKTDGKGRFRVEGVPVGLVTVSFAYHM